ncbi:MAG: stage II sporulation protein M [Bacteroidia bacterium]|nr:stage II sporulation protein M [Bacteroidia bacterium]
MRRIVFLKYNKDKWKNYENVLANHKNANPVELTHMLIDITEDLGYAQTHYPDTDVERYVNNLASRIHQSIYKNKRYGEKVFKKFFLNTIPDLIWKNKRYFFYSFAAFFLSSLLGFVSEKFYPDYVRLILGDYYVDATIERIKNGDPLGVYKEKQQFLMFIQIAFNNIRVSFLIFAAGLLTSFGAYYLLCFNGIMLGSFFAMFHNYNVFDQALKVVWIHGTIEISSIIIAGAAGIMIGNSFLFPGTYPRLYHFQTKSKQAISLIYALIPFFLVAAWLESYVTRYTQMPLFLSLIIIIGSFILMTGYFFLFPYLYHLKLKKYEQRSS